MNRKIENTVIITSFNRLKYFRNCILSIMNQSVRPDEIVIADDGSSEDIVIGIQDLVKELPCQVTFVRQENKGFRAAMNRNNGVRHAKGNFFVFVDQDMIFTKKYLEAVFANKRKKTFYTSWPVWLGEEQTARIDSDLISSADYSSLVSPVQRRSIYEQYRKEKFYTVLYNLKLRKTCLSLRSCVFGIYRSDFVKVNGFDETFRGWGCEDDDLGLRLHAAGIRGVNNIYDEYALHCYHPKAKRAEDGRSVNRAFFKKRKKEINGHNYRCEYGYETPVEPDGVTVMVLNSGTE